MISDDLYRWIKIHLMQPNDEEKEAMLAAPREYVKVCYTGHDKLKEEGEEEPDMANYKRSSKMSYQNIQA